MAAISMAKSNVGITRGSAYMLKVANKFARQNYDVFETIIVKQVYTEFRTYAQINLKISG